MKNEQIGIFINTGNLEYLVGICVNLPNQTDEKGIMLAETKTKSFVEPLKTVKVNMIKKFDLNDFKAKFKDELTFVNNHNKENKLSLSHLQILQITYILNIRGEKTENTFLEAFNNLNNFYDKNLK